MKNIKMTIAAILAATTMSAMAGSIPGLSGFEANGTGFTGNAAITNITDIIAAVGNTSGNATGTVIDNTKFWQSFVQDTKTQTFDYSSAESMIEELVFTVLGQTYGSKTINGTEDWFAANTVVSSELTEDGLGYKKMDEVFATRVSNVERAATSVEVTAAAEANGVIIGGVKTAAILDDPATTGINEAADEVLYVQADVVSSAGFDAGTVRKGNYLDAKLKTTGVKAIDLLTALSFTVTDSDTTVVSSVGFGTFTCTGSAADGCATTDAQGDAQVDNTDISLLNDITTVASPSSSTGISSVVLADSGSAFATAVDAAKINEGGFVNANLLIQEISNQLKNGYILDVAKATSAVTAVIAHHNGFLGASVVQEAHRIKDIIKTIGLQVAAAEVSKAAADSCVASNGSTSGKACVAIGSKFQSILSDLGTIENSGSDAAAYNVALAEISAFADSIISFNSTVNGYIAGDAFASIENQYGTITVIVDTDDDNNSDTFYESLVTNDTATNGTGNPITIADWNIGSDLGNIEDFDLTFTLDGVSVELK